MEHIRLNAKLSNGEKFLRDKLRNSYSETLLQDKRKNTLIMSSGENLGLDANSVVMKDHRRRLNSIVAGKNPWSHGSGMILSGEKLYQNLIKAYRNRKDRAEAIFIDKGNYIFPCIFFFVYGVFFSQ